MTVGLNSSLKLIKSGEAEKALLAKDCSESLKERVRAAASEHGVKVDESRTMAELGADCGIEVGCAVCAIRKNK